MGPEASEHVGKRVVAQNGTEVGTVREERDGTLYVAVGPDADTDVVDELGWGGVVHQRTHELDNRFISTITDETVRLRV